MSRHNLLIRETCRGLLALTAHDLGVHLVGTRVQQLDGLVFQIPERAIVEQVRVILYPLARNQFGRFNSYCCCLCHYQGLFRAGRQAKAEQPNREQACCFV